MTVPKLTDLFSKEKLCEILIRLCEKIMEREGKGESAELLRKQCDLASAELDEAHERRVNAGRIR
jgi:hypothetical protein